MFEAGRIDGDLSTFGIILSIVGKLASLGFEQFINLIV